MDNKATIAIVLIRWIFTLPIAAISYIITYTLMIWWCTWILNLSVFDLSKFANLPAASTAGLTFILGGVFTAPFYRSQTSIALLVINIIFLTLFTYAYFSGDINTERSVYDVISEYIFAIIGSAAGTYISIAVYGFKRTSNISDLK